MDIPKQASKQAEEMISALGISECSEELQAKILSKFGEILFKRLLLLLPDNIGREVIAEITTLPLEEGMKRLVALIDAHVPDAVARRNEILEETIAEFRPSKNDKA